MASLRAWLPSVFLLALVSSQAAAAPPYMPDEDMEYLPYGEENEMNAAAYENYMERLMQLNQVTLSNHVNFISITPMMSDFAGYIALPLR